MDSYGPLNAWLRGQPATTINVPTTFRQIEHILGFSLPVTAKVKSQWWENNATGHSQAKAWLAAGFVTRDVNILTETLTFSRNR